MVSLKGKENPTEKLMRHKRAGKNDMAKMIFVSSCIEASARRRQQSTSAMYQRMKAVGLVTDFILPCYDGLHTQSREHVTEDVLGALELWERKKGIQP